MVHSIYCLVSIKENPLYIKTQTKGKPESSSSSVHFSLSLSCIHYRTTKVLKEKAKCNKPKTKILQIDNSESLKNNEKHN